MFSLFTSFLFLALSVLFDTAEYAGTFSDPYPEVHQKARYEVCQRKRHQAFYGVEIFR